jgi:hypothetical protein
MPSEHGVELDFLSIETALPVAFRSLKFEAVILSVNRNLVKHYLSASVRAACFQLEDPGLLPSAFPSAGGVPLFAETDTPSKKANNPAATAAIFELSVFRSAGWDFSSRSRKPVSMFPA